MNLKLSCLCLSVVAAFGASQAFELGKVEVKSKALQNLTTTSGVRSFSSNSANLFGTTDVAEAAKYVAGASFVATGGKRNEEMIIIRGVSRTPVFIDGFPVYVSYDGSIDLGRFLASSYAQIDFSKSSSSLLYGANSLGSVINLVTKQPTKAFEGEIHYGAKYSPQNAGKNTHSLYDNFVDARFGSKFEKFFFQVDGSFREGFHTPLASGIAPKEDPSYSNEKRDKRIAAKIGITPDSNEEYVFSYSKQEGEKSAKFYEGADPSQKNDYWWWPQWDKESYALHSKLDFGDSFTINTRAYYDKFTNVLRNMKDYKYEDLAEGKKGWVSQYDDYTFGVGMELIFRGESDEFKIAPQFKQDVHHSKQVYPNNPSLNEPTQRVSDKILTLALEETFRPDESTNIIFGASVNSRRAGDAQGWGIPDWDKTSNTSYIFNYETKDETVLNFQVLVEKSFNGNDAAYFSIGSRTYFPTQKERYTSRFGKYIQNPDLLSEDALNFVVGYRADYAKASYDASVFYTKWQDKIQAVKVQRDGVNYEQNQNVGEAEIYGGELALKLRPNNQVTLGLDYAYTEVKLRADGVFLTHIPRNKLSAYGEFKITPSVKFTATQLAQSSTHSNSDGSFDAAGFGVTNIKLGFDITRNFNLEVGIENLWDKLYAYTEGYFEAGRTIRADVRYKF